LEQYFGVHGVLYNRRSGQTGAGHPNDEDDSESELEEETLSNNEEDSESESDIASVLGDQHASFRSLHTTIAENLQRNINHKPVKPPRSQLPFNADLEYTSFKEGLTAVNGAGLLPRGYGVKQSEWDVEEGYPTDEEITVGRQKKVLTVHLPHAIWMPRAILWAQGLYTMQANMYLNEEQN